VLSKGGLKAFLICAGAFGGDNTGYTDRGVQWRADYSTHAFINNNIVANVKMVPFGGCASFKDGSTAATVPQSIKRCHRSLLHLRGLSTVNVGFHHRRMRVDARALVSWA
jgi:hypothetical protein